MSPEYGLQWQMMWAGFPPLPGSVAWPWATFIAPSGSHLLSGTEPISQGHCED